MKNDNNKLETISNLFEDNEIRSVWDAHWRKNNMVKSCSNSKK